MGGGEGGLKERGRKFINEHYNFQVLPSLSTVSTQLHTIFKVLASARMIKHSYVQSKRNRSNQGNLPSTQKETYLIESYVSKNCLYLVPSVSQTTIKLNLSCFSVVLNQFDDALSNSRNPIKNKRKQKQS